MKRFATWLCAVATMALLTVPAFAWGDTQAPVVQPANNGLSVSRGASIGILLVIIASAIMMVVSLVTVIMTYKTYSKMSDDKKEELDRRELEKKKAKKAKHTVEELPDEDEPAEEETIDEDDDESDSIESDEVNGVDETEAVEA